MNLRGIILDLDMTIADTLERFFLIYNKIRKKFGLEEIKKKEFLERFELDSLSEGIPGEILEDFWKEFRREYCYAFTEKDRLIPGALELLQGAKRKGLRVILTTGRECPPEVIWEELERYGISEYIDAVYTLEMQDPKEEKKLFYRREILERALKDFGLRPEEVVFVADYLPDMECGRDLGIFTIGVKTGKKSPEALYCHGASKVLRDIGEVKEFLGLRGVLNELLDLVPDNIPLDNFLDIIRGLCPAPLCQRGKEGHEAFRGMEGEGA